MKSQNKKLPLAICGFGRFATRRIMPAIAECSNIELSAVVDHSGKASGLSAGVNIFPSLDAFLETNPVGAVHITSPNHLHAKQSLQCLEAGLHVLCEKPMATNSADCQIMLGTARDLNLNLRVGHMLRYSPAVQLARQWLQDGAVGQLLSISTTFNYELPEINRPWAFRSGNEGGGALMDAGIHCVDVIRLLTGDPLSVKAAITDRHSHQDGVERSAHCKFVAGAVDCSLKVDSHAPYKTLLTISGVKGEIVIDNFAACWGGVTIRQYEPHSGAVAREETVDASTIYAKQLQDFAETIVRSVGNAAQDVAAAENVKLIEELYAIS